MPGLAPCVGETVTVNGTGTVSLSGTVATSVGALQTFFQGFGSSGESSVQYRILGTVSGAWETNIGTFNGGNPGTLTRGLVNSSTGSAINFSSEVCTITCDIIADANGNIPLPSLPTGVGAPMLFPISSNVSVLGMLNNTGTTNVTTTANRQSFVPFRVTKPTVISNLGCYVNTGSSGTTFSVGIYTDNGSTGGTGNQPTGSPIVSVSGLSSATAGAVLGSVGTPFTLLPNVDYWRSSIHSAAVSMKVINLGGEAGSLGISSAGVAVLLYYLSGSGTTLATLSSPTLSQATVSPAALMIYS